MPANYSLQLSGKYLLRRILRIEPPYIASILLAVFVAYLINSNYHPDINNILTHLAYINNFTGKPYLSPVYWTLGIEFQYYVFVGIFFPLINKKWGILLLLLLCLLPFFIAVPGTTLLSVFPFFALGILYYYYLTGTKRLPELLVCGIAITLISFFTAGWMQTLAGLFALLLLIIPSKPNNLINFFSRISFSLYLTHDIVGSRVVVFMGMHLPKTIPFKAIEFLTGIGVSILFAYLFFILIEQPCLRLSKKIKY